MRADIGYNNIIDGDDFVRAQQAADEAANLDHTQIDTKKFYVTQHYERYSEENHRVWKTMYEKRWDVLAKQASRTYLAGLEAINLVSDRVPLLFGEAPDPYDPSRKVTGINEYLRELTGWQSHGVPGYLPAKAFFSCLAQREFPSTIVIRPETQMDYLPEPDIFHDVAGHVPMHTDTRFADVLVRFGEVAREAALRAQSMSEGEERLHLVESNIKALARFFWFTVEFGLMKQPNSEWGVCAYGSGLLSSTGELEYCVTSPKVQRYPAQLEWVINQYFEIDHYQPLLFVIDNFDQLFGMVDELAVWLRDGKLDNVSPGEPAINEEDLKSFLEADVAE